MLIRNFIFIQQMINSDLKDDVAIVIAAGIFIIIIHLYALGGNRLGGEDTFAFWDCHNQRFEIIH